MEGYRWGSSTACKDLDQVLQQQLVDTTLLFKAMAPCWEKDPWLFMSKGAVKREGAEGKSEMARTGLDTFPSG